MIYLLEVKNLSFEHFLILWPWLFLLFPLLSIALDILQSVLGPVDFLRELGFVEVDYLLGSILDCFQLFVYQLQFVNFFQRSAESLLIENIFSFTVGGSLVLKLIPKSNLVIQNAALVSLCFQNYVLRNPFEVHNSFLSLILHLLIQILSSL